MGGENYHGFLTRATVLQGVRQPTLVLTWLTNNPVWVDQWPLPIEKLKALQELVAEQLAAGHIEPSQSPWNTPVFVIKKKSGKWRFLHDLQQVNAVMATMGALQPGMPSPAMIPQDWEIIVMDLKDCFFTIPLASQDKEKFAFSVPSINHAEPAKRYQWRVLPQGMKNSPTICQWFVAQALSPVREKFPTSYCYHYMDDILLASDNKEQLNDMENLARNLLQQYGLVIAPEKVQKIAPWKYLGMTITSKQVVPQPVKLNLAVKTLNDVQKLMGSLNWIRPYLGLTNSQLQPLLDLLKHSNDPTEPRILNKEALNVIHMVEQCIYKKFVSRIDLSQLVQFFVLIDKTVPFGALVQWNSEWDDPLHILEWMFLSFRPRKTASGLFELIADVIIKTRKRCVELIGRDPATIVLPVQNWYFEWCLANNYELQVAMAGFQRQISYHLPSHLLLKFAQEIPFGQKYLSQPEPVKGPTVFTDGSGKTGKAAVVCLLQRALQRAAGTIFLAQIQKGGIVGGCNGSAECLTVREQRDLEQLVVYP
ncbi:PREDICTED: endogenous retrovirus group K member 11 Pol protein-like [Haliaeetus leucocephalus]|uniref:endogenous retrovirus group K member 11 Pol protein-like n=1 Tax=Haliaeetus leucocephalus TaxID=52644 RepID=UPI00053CAD36|nr:PREDICTED: endogenous retrovirus group K member 11 Pol protein-like [Haliaeetus leucocephalus]